ncbi:hypothetical protein [Emcibacter sp.]|uniref:hypothetical protein n=1 Tax=Emcibacter sp. TaxID=1979954 RepID=UPI002AA797D6|nr:hypothetical protein [Emcibacter sp.]
MQNFFDILEQEKGLSAEEVQRRLDQFALILRSIPATMKYHYHSPELEAFYRESGLKDCDAFHRLAVLQLMESFRTEQLPVKVPESIGAFYVHEFDRLRTNVADADYVFGWENDLFAKDIGIVSGRLIPAGPGLLEISGVPRSLLFKKGISQFFRLAIMMLFGLKGRGPLLTIHIHLANLEQFNPAGWEKSYRLIGEILELNTHLKGLMRHAWFFDPAVAKISPKLAYLREIPEQYGAGIFYHSDEDADSGALTRSGTRRNLFEKGDYTPRVYYLLWPRRQLINYSRTLGRSF